MSVSVSVQKISTSTMKFLGVISLCLACVAARGSGPYLPSGWKPSGPAFYLPSEVSKVLNEPLKETVLSESEASGSDFLREYGPPKVQEVSQDISQQGLPDVVNEQLFVETVVGTISGNENSNVVIQQKLEGNDEVKSTEEALAITELQSLTTTESIANVEIETVKTNDIKPTQEASAVPESQPIITTESLATIEEEADQINDETTTIASDVVSVDGVDDFGYIVEPTVAIIIPTEIVTTEANEKSENQILGDIVVESQQLNSQIQNSNESSKLEETLIVDTQFTSNAEQASTDVSEQAEPSIVEPSETSVTQLAGLNVDIISASEKKIEEEENNVERVVQNIPELINKLENEVKSQQPEAIQEAPAVAQDLLGSLEQAPEGFLEYGPPGFREYGPPKGDLRDNTIEENIPETQSNDITESRRRRFSPKFTQGRTLKLSAKLH